MGRESHQSKKSGNTENQRSRLSQRKLQAQSSLAPEALTTPAQRLISAPTKSPNCAGVNAPNSAPLLAQMALSSSLATA
jgi:hypothetical protein